MIGAAIAVSLVKVSACWGSIIRTSAMAPEIADAAAVAGLARWVRARGPWRPMKLRLDVETERWPGGTVSPLAAQAHRASGLAPFEAGVGEKLIRAPRRRHRA
jgi:hypothetical protein